MNVLQYRSHKLEHLFNLTSSTQQSSLFLVAVCIDRQHQWEWWLVSVTHNVPMGLHLLALVWNLYWLSVIQYLTCSSNRYVVNSNLYAMYFICQNLFEFCWVVLAIPSTCHTHFQHYWYEFWHSQSPCCWHCGCDCFLQPQKAQPLHQLTHLLWGAKPDVTWTWSPCFSTTALPDLASTRPQCVLVLLWP